jgi:NAD+ synthetase
MIYLYNLAQQHKGLVLSTDNYTELLEGYWTLHGDVGDYGMIQSLWKTEVYELSKYLVEHELKQENEKQALQLCIDAVPTDGLGITSSDFEQLDAKNYNEVDFILKDYIENGNKKWENHSVIQRHIRSAYKRNNPYNLSREILFK